MNKVSRFLKELKQIVKSILCICSCECKGNPTVKASVT